MNKCASCKKIFNTEPLIDFTGAERCPICKGNAFPNVKTSLEITPESRALYIQSERLFKEKYLLSNDVKSRTNALNRAIENCDYAGLYLHDPYALNLLAFFYENNYTSRQGGKTSWELALECYKTVCFNENYGSEGVVIHYNDTDSNKLSPAEIEELRFSAGVGIIRLMANIPPHIYGKSLDWDRKNAIDICQKLARTREKQLTLKRFKTDTINKATDAPLGFTVDEMAEVLIEYSQKNKLFMYLAHMKKEDFVELSNKNLGQGFPDIFAYSKRTSVIISIAPTYRRTVQESFRRYNHISDLDGEDFANADGVAILMINTAKTLNVKGIKASELARMLVETNQDQQMILRQWSGAEIYNRYKITTDDIEICTPTDARSMSKGELIGRILQNLVNSIIM